MANPPRSKPSSDIPEGLPVQPADAEPLPVERVEQDPSMTRKPPEGRKFPCRQCGARLDFDPSHKALKCPYCGFEEKIEASKAGVEEQDWDAYWKNHEDKETVLAGRSSQVTCGGCGAVVLLEDKVQTDKCPYCATHLENKPEAAKAMIAPEGVLPFKVPERDAVHAFNGWIASRWFAPSTLRQFANLGKLNGLYVPYWTYDSMTYTFYTGQRGDDYTVSETYTETDANGNTVTKTRNVTHTRWTHVSGQVQHFFDDVVICASKGLPEPLVRSLEPWDLPKLEGFQDSYLSGFQTERYAVGLKEGFGKAQAIMDNAIRGLCCQDIGGNHQRLETVQTQHVGITFKHMVLPVWAAAYRYQDQAYRILINGRNGKVVGTRPYSVIKIVMLVLLILALVGIIAFIVMQSQRGPNQGAPPRRAAVQSVLACAEPGLHRTFETRQLLFDRHAAGPELPHLSSQRQNPLRC